MTAARVLLLSADPSQAGGPGAVVSDVERRRAARHRVEVDRQRSLGVAVLLRQAVGRLTGAAPADVRTGRWCRSCSSWGDHGRPVALDDDARPLPGVHLSASHAGALVLVAASPDAPLGVDVERVEGVRFAGFDDAVLTDGERALLQGFPTDDRDRERARSWTRKESLLKATGHGLSVAPRRTAFAGTTLTSWPHELDADLAAGTRTADLPGLPAGLVGAVTVLAPDLDLRSGGSPAGDRGGGPRS